MRKAAVVLWIAVTASPASFAPPAQQANTVSRRFEFSRLEMGTSFRIVLFASERRFAEAAAEAAFDRIRELDRHLSDYRADSELNKVCQSAVSGPAVVSADLFTVLDAAQKLAGRSGGAFDVTVRPVIELWRRARRTGRLPDRTELDAALDRVGFRKLHLNPLTRSVRLEREGMGLDLGGIAKGYAADEALGILARRGFARALVEAGGDVRLGLPPAGDEGWTVALEGSVQPRTWKLAEVAVATSGDDLQSLRLGGQRYSHIIDPRTGMALTDRRLVTVIAPQAMMADALATALSVLEPEAGMRLLQRYPGASARIEVRERGRLWVSEGFPDF